jgi:hypothetical protein
VADPYVTMTLCCYYVAEALAGQPAEPREANKLVTAKIS